MSKEQLHLVFYGSDVSLLEKLKALSTEIPQVSYQVGNGKEVTGSSRLDAIWAGLMGAVDLFGLTPPFPLHEAIIVKVPKPQVDAGFPSFAIAGVAVSKNDPKTAEFVFRLTINALTKAVREFNVISRQQIVRIGILPEDLQLQKLQPKSALAVIAQALEL